MQAIIQNYVEALQNGKQLRIKYNKKNDDFCGGWWSEELWSYDNERKIFILHYPTSSYTQDFFTEVDAEDFAIEMKMNLHNFNGDYEIQTVTDIILEENGHFISTSAIKERAIAKIKTMSDEEIIRRLFS